MQETWHAMVDVRSPGLRRSRSYCVLHFMHFRLLSLMTKRIHSLLLGRRMSSVTIVSILRVGTGWHSQLFSRPMSPVVYVLAIATIAEKLRP